MSYGNFQAEYRSSSPICPPDASSEFDVISGASEFTSQLSPNDLVFLDSDPALAPRGEYGSFRYDQSSGKFNRSWDSWQSFERFLEKEQNTLSIELLKVQTRSGNRQYLERRVYACSRGHTGGRKVYDKKHPDWNRKVDKKFTDCPCRLVVKSYSGVGTLLGAYRPEHNHPVGENNLKFTRISKETRNWIASMVRGKVDSNHILDLLHRGYESTPDNDSLRIYSPPSSQARNLERNDFIVLADIRRIEKAILAETVRLDADDGASVFKWSQKIEAADSLLAFKSVSCPVPSDSNLRSDTFFLAIQTPWQLEQYRLYGSNVLLMDGTHNTTMYENLTLFSLLVRNKWGRGIPIAWLLASNGTEETLGYFIGLVRGRSFFIIPRWILSDRDLAQINALRRHFHTSILLLCWWHVLHAWQQHLRISDHPVLWEKLKAWIRIDSVADFEATWCEIKALSPPSFLAYLEKYWVTDEFRPMWSGILRKGRSIFEESDTTMLVEAWHHVLKGKFLEGRRNRRIDHLLYILLCRVIHYYSVRAVREVNGFEGPDLEVQKRQAIINHGLVIPRESVLIKDTGGSSLASFHVKSMSIPGHIYEVDIVAYFCSCPDFPSIDFCKHIFAVQRYFPSSDSETSAELEGIASEIDPPSTPPTFPLSESTVLAEDTDERPANSTLESDDKLASRQESLDSLRIIQKLETLAACMRHMPDGHPSLKDGDVLENLIDQHLVLFQNGSAIVPRTKKLAPCLNSWPETQAVMMPPAKTRKKRVGDAYGGGELSGKKAKKDPPSKPAASSTVKPTSSITTLSEHPSHNALPMAGPSSAIVPTVPVPFMYYYQPYQPYMYPGF